MEKEKQGKTTRKLSAYEKEVISEATERLFAVHYLNMGYYFMESDIDIFYYVVNKNKEANKTRLPMAQDLDYCYLIVQNILYIVRMLRYEQRMLGTYLLRCNVKIKDLYFKVKDMTSKNKQDLEQDLLKLVGLFADIEAMKQYLIMVLKILKIDTTLYKDYVIKSQLNNNDYKKYFNYTLVEYLNDNIFLSDIYEKLEEIQTFLNKDDSQVYDNIYNRLKNSDTDTTIKQILQTFKSFSADTLKDATKMQKDLPDRDAHINTFKKILLERGDRDLLSISIDYLNTISDYYRDQILLRGLEYEKQTPKK